MQKQRTIGKSGTRKLGRSDLWQAVRLWLIWKHCEIAQVKFLRAIEHGARGLLIAQGR